MAVAALLAWPEHGHTPLPHDLFPHTSSHTHSAGPYERDRREGVVHLRPVCRELSGSVLSKHVVMALPACSPTLPDFHDDGGLMCP